MSDAAPPLRWSSVLFALVGPAVVAPVALWAANPGRVIEIPIVVGVGLVSLGLVTVLARLAKASLPNHLVAAQAGTLAFWGWGAVPADVFAAGWLELLVGMAWVGVAVWIGSRLKSFDWLPLVLGAGFGAASLAMIVTGISGDRPPSNVADPPIPQEMASASANGDVLVLVVDGYTSPSILMRDYGYDIGQTVDSLEHAGFVVPDSTLSNFGVTDHSLPTLLGLEYPLVYGEDALRSKPEAYATRLISGDAGLMDWMGDIGYDVTKLRSGWELDRCGQVDRCVGKAGLTGMTSWILFQRTPMRGIAAETIGHPYPRNAISVLESLPELVAAADANDRPDFVMAHVIAPHGPYFLSPSCELGPETPSNAAGESGYIKQVACVNVHLERLADALDSTQFSVLIVGDHGSDEGRDNLWGSADWSERELTELFSIFVASRTPDGCVVEEPSLINVARSFLNCAVGVDLAPIEDRFYGSNVDGGMYDVTDRMLSAQP